MEVSKVWGACKHCGSRQRGKAPGVHSLWKHNCVTRHQRVHTGDSHYYWTPRETRLHKFSGSQDYLINVSMSKMFFFPSSRAQGFQLQSSRGWTQKWQAHAVNLELIAAPSHTGTHAEICLTSLQSLHLHELVRTVDETRNFRLQTNTSGASPKLSRVSAVLL